MRCSTSRASSAAVELVTGVVLEKIFGMGYGNRCLFPSWLEGLGECYELYQWSLGQKRILAYFEDHKTLYLHLYADALSSLGFHVTFGEARPRFGAVAPMPQTSTEPGWWVHTYLCVLTVGSVSSAWPWELRRYARSYLQTGVGTNCEPLWVLQSSTAAWEGTTHPSQLLVATEMCHFIVDYNCCVFWSVLINLYHWKQEWILYRGVADFSFTSP